jgi:serine-type D-Ala-D-Ala carboxypeptidase/endopeptidase
MTRWLLTLLPLLACGIPEAPGPIESPTDAGPVVEDAGIPDGGAGPDFSELAAYLGSIETRGVINGYAMQVFDAEERLVFQRAFGRCVTQPCPAGSPAFTPTLVTGIASSTKWITSTVALAVIEEQVERGAVPSLEAGLDERLAPRLNCGAVGPFADITLRQLLSFTSGVQAEHDCTSQSLAACACPILRNSSLTLVMNPSGGSVRNHGHLPGTTFKYGESHHTVAGALLEAWTGESFPQLFERLVRAKLGVTMRYKSRLNLAGSIDSSVADVAVFVRAIAHDGRGAGPKRLLSKAAVEAQRALQVGPTVVLRTSPQEGGQYGLNTWRWCYRPFDSPMPSSAQSDPTCQAVFLSGHGGKGGYAPFLSVRHGYAAVFAMREDAITTDESYAAEQVGITQSVRFLTERAFGR